MIAKRREVQYSQPREGRPFFRGGRSRGGTRGRGHDTAQRGGDPARNTSSEQEEREPAWETQDGTADPEGLAAMAFRTNNKRNSVDSALPLVTRVQDPPTFVGEGTLAIVGKTPLGVPPMPPVYVSPRKVNKRSKQGDHLAEKAAGKGEKAKNGISAGSSGECRREQ